MLKISVIYNKADQKYWPGLANKNVTHSAVTEQTVNPLLERERTMFLKIKENIFQKGNKLTKT